MRKLSVLIVLVYLLLPLAFSAAQEGGDTETEVSKNDVIEQAEAPSAEGPSAEEPSPSIEKVSDAQPPSGEIEETAEQEQEHFVFSLNFFLRLIIVIAIIIIQALLIRLLWYLFKKLNKKIGDSASEKLKPLVIKKLKILTTKQILGIIEFLLRILKYVITVVQLFITLPIIFSLFSATRNIATFLFNYLLTELKNIVLSIGGYIPKLITIFIIVFITRYILRGIKYIASQIEKEKVVIPGFYPDWAKPTYKILQVLLWAFTLALIYPYLPGSNSRAFQGVSVFIGIIFSIGSTSAIGNLVAGLVITYMRPFKIGDRVQIKEITGFVVEKNLMVVRVKTHKNEYVTFPNVMILGSNIINYNTSSDEDEEGLILNFEVTYGYATPWQTIHEILINAALATEYVQKKPKPFVLQTALDDFYARYQINCYTKEVSKAPLIYSLLFQNIQDGFNEAGLDMTTAHFRIVSKKDK
jgi:small-conductance mechanosensitive channel